MDDLNGLYNQLLTAGCNRFYIDGVGGPQHDDVDCLGCNQGVWEVYYMERGHASPPFFSTPHLQEAIDYYYQHIMSIEHWHLVTFTRSFQLKENRKIQLQQAGIPIIENNIPNYAQPGDLVYRQFITNEHIFKAKQLLIVVPYMDEGLQNQPMAR
jgi:hypothetical protein